MENRNSEHFQWIADCYHCSENWGSPMTEADMTELLTETALQDPEGDTPPVYLAGELAAYWNELCRRYPY